MKLNPERLERPVGVLLLVATVLWARELSLRVPDLRRRAAVVHELVAADTLCRPGPGSCVGADGLAVARWTIPTASLELPEPRLPCTAPLGEQTRIATNEAGDLLLYEVREETKRKTVTRTWALVRQRHEPDMRFVLDGTHLSHAQGVCVDVVEPASGDVLGTTVVNRDLTLNVEERDRAWFYEVAGLFGGAAGLFALLILYLQLRRGAERAREHRESH
ncbi:MAG: hypothetical protein R3A78_05190 [Polyangiales bacterium]|nr:hypothetical protein [Myxococcales bacterium]